MTLTISNDRLDNCPKCNMNFNGTDIYEFFLDQYNRLGGYHYPISIKTILDGAKNYPEQYLPLPPNLETMSQNELDAWDAARSYGWRHDKKKGWRNEIGIKISNLYDGVALYKCPECGYVWKRFDWVDDKYVDEEYNYD